MKLPDWRGKREQEDRELDEEMRFHLQEEARLRAGRGEDEASAQAAARRDFGNAARVKELSRENWTWSALERATQDARYALRMFRMNPAVTALAVVSLALGIGATTAIFSVVHAVLLRPLAFPEPQRLAMIWELSPHSDHHNVVQTQNFLDWRARNRSFERMAAVFPVAMNLESGASAVQVMGMQATPGFFETLGVRPLAGRGFAPEEETPSSPCVAVLGYGLWQRRFGGDRRVVGTSMQLSGHSCNVVGVMPEGFHLPTDPRVDLYTAMTNSPQSAPLEGRNYKVVARLRPGVTLAQADAEMRAIAAQTAAERPKMNTDWSATVLPLMEQTVGDVRTALVVLMGAALFVMLIACANVSNLLLMRAAKRQREMTVRMALGAGKWRIFHQSIVESLLLASVGAGGGFLIAFWGVPAILGMLPANFPLPRRDEIAVDPAVLAFTIAAAVACALLFGVLPALQAGGPRLTDGLRAGGRGVSGGHRGLRNLLVVAEVTLAMLLVIGAGLMLRSFALLNSVDPGFKPERVLAFRMILVTPAKTFEQVEDRRRTLAAEMIERARSIPGVAAASSMHMLPMLGQLSGTWYSRADRPAPPLGSNAGGDVSVVSDEYFRTMGVRLLAGRDFDMRDTVGAPRVAILNQTAARMVFEGDDPVGKRLRIAWGTSKENPLIVGVAADMRHRDMDTRPEPCVYLPHGQSPSAFFALVVRTKADPDAIVPAVKEQVRQASASQGIQDIQTMDQLIAGSVARPKLDATIMAVFGAIALALACLGIYAVISYSVEQRMREMGIRLALGAPPRGLLRMVLREGLILAGAGIIAGAIGALALTRYLESLLYTIKPADPMVFSSVAAILALAAMAGCYFPASRATRVDPVVVLRQE
jgi:putative ABC transport system permease protein